MINYTYEIRVRGGKLGTGRHVLKEEHPDDTALVEARVEELKLLYPKCRVSMYNVPERGPWRGGYFDEDEYLGRQRSWP